MWMNVISFVRTFPKFALLGGLQKERESAKPKELLDQNRLQMCRQLPQWGFMEFDLLQLQFQTVLNDT